MDWLLIGSMFLLGLGGSLHCLGMCGPLVMAVPFPKSRSTYFTQFLYFFGKALAYGLLGILVGLMGLKSVWGESQRFISVFAGVLILLMTVFPLLKPGIGRFFFQKQFQSVYKQISKSPGWYHFLQLGFLNGLLPCGMVYMALAAALAAGSPVNAFIGMLVFGFGTAPILWAIAILKTGLKFDLKSKLKPITVSISIFVGLLLILRGLNLGIPYISPKMDTSQPVEMNHSHHHHH